MEFLHAENKKIVTESGRPVLLRGFGLGGWLLPEGYQWKLRAPCDRPRRMEALTEELCGKDYSEKFWASYFAGYVSERDIEFISRRGMNCVRLPINARHYPRCLKQIDALIGWCRRRGIYVILDMHAAPGGQTGTNIDDSETDSPRLFLERRFQGELEALWVSLAERYAEEPAVAGYDLLNEPLPNWNSQLNGEVMPLYRRLISAVRRVDRRHLVILEGVHWATDWSIFGEMQNRLPDGNLLLQFHKYWNPPDAESIEPYTDARSRLGLPVLMGEGGENNCGWYTGLFPMLEEQEISWNFWSYKKMDCVNSPVTFPVPRGWEELNGYIEGRGGLSAGRAVSIFDDFLDAVVNRCTVNPDVCRALNREAPIAVPAEFFSSCRILTPRKPGAVLRMKSPATILFRSGEEGRAPDYRDRGGGPNPESERLCVQLHPGEWLEYLFRTSAAARWRVTVRCQNGGPGCALTAQENGKTVSLVRQGDDFSADLRCKSGRHLLRVRCISGEVQVSEICIRESGGPEEGSAVKTRTKQ